MTSKAGVLYVVATPIGNLEDISVRAQRILSEVDLIAAEDSRTSSKLLNHLGIRNRIQSFHEHNEQQQVSNLKQLLEKGQSIALISDAGTPLISDPGYHLVKTLRQADIRVIPIPGPSALITALSVSGLATDRFCFEGFLPAKASARRKTLTELGFEKRTLVFYESCHRIVNCLEDMRQIFGADRQLTLCRELTKKFETIHTAPLVDFCDWIQQGNQQKGEFVLVVEGHSDEQATDFSHLDQQLGILLQYLSPSQASAALAQMSGERKKVIYQRALTLQDDLQSS